MRGNVETRLKKLEGGIADATLLAAAGLVRLGLIGRATSLIEPDDWLPAVGQGAIAVTARTDDGVARAMLAAIDHRDTSVALATERAYLAVLDGSCRTPIGGLARINGASLGFKGMIVKPDGSKAHVVERIGTTGEAERLGADAGAELARKGGPGFFAAG